MSFKKYGKIIEGYIELLTLFPIFHNLSLEHFEAKDNSIRIIISNRTEIWNIKDYDIGKKPQIRILTYDFTLIQKEEIIKEDNNEIKSK